MSAIINDILARLISVLDKLPSLFQPYEPIVTAGATVVLAIFTLALFRATKRMATATFEPHVVANLELNQWSLMHVDWVIEICGNAPAYDIKIDYEAIGTLKQPELCDPFNGISLLRPTQKLTSSAGQWQDLEKHKIKVQISWKRHANTKKRQINSYIIDLSGWSEVSFLGARKPEVQIASEIKNIRDDWRPFASGSRKISVDTFTQADRDDHSQRMHEYIEEQKSKKK